MKNTHYGRLMLSVLVALAASPCMAWHDEGHMVVAEIAYKHLSDPVKAKCDALIAVQLPLGASTNNTFITASCWPDDYKTELGTRNQHYIDMPISLDGTKTIEPKPASSDLIRAIRDCVTTLQSTNASSTEQGTSLRYLIHFIGDIHQPLHCATGVTSLLPDGDLGGNKFPLLGEWKNLHILWDAGGGFVADKLIRPLDSANQAILDAKVADIEKDHPYQPTLKQIPDFMEWAKDSNGLAKSVCYEGIHKNTAPSSQYIAKAKKLTDERLALAGHRLADLLELICK